MVEIVCPDYPTVTISVWPTMYIDVDASRLVIGMQVVVFQEESQTCEDSNLRRDVHWQRAQPLG